MSLMELMVVLAIVAIMSAVAIPQISRYLQNYQIKAAAQVIASEINAARTKAIMKNVNRGVTFVALNNRSFRWVNEDIPAVTGGVPACMGAAFRTATVADILSNATACRDQLGPIRELPAGVVFDITNTTPLTQGYACGTLGSLEVGFRFRRLGDWCDPSSTDVTCPSLGTTNMEAMFRNSPAGSGVCVFHQSSRLRRLIQVAPGGRVQVR